MKLSLRKFLTAAAVTLAASLPAAAQTAPATTPAPEPAVAPAPAPAPTPDEKQFDIALPAGFAQFTTQTQKTESPEGTVETTNWVSRAGSGEAVVVTVSKMPGRILDPNKLMDATRDSLLKSLKATLENEQDIEGAHAATLLQFKSDAAVLQSKLLVDDDRFYQVLYVGRSAEQRSAPAIAQLFDSFHVAEPAAADVPAQPTPQTSAEPSVQSSTQASAQPAASQPEPAPQP